MVALADVHGADARRSVWSESSGGADMSDARRPHMRKGRRANRASSRIGSAGVEVMPGLPLTAEIGAILETERQRARRGEGPWPPDPLAPGELSGFVSWLRTVPDGSLTGLPRYMQAIYDGRRDLQEKMPEVSYGELGAFEWWAHEHGRREEPMVRYFGHRVTTRRQVHPEGRVDGGADIIGFFNAEHGLGQSARLIAGALRAAEVPISTIGCRNTQSRQRFPFRTDEVGRYRTVITAINAEMNEQLRRDFGDFFFAGTYVIGQWFWELEAAPSWYESSYRYVDELWAPTRFIENMLRQSAPRHVHIEYMPLPLRTPKATADITRSDLGIDDRFLFMFTFDFMSVAKRKNPVGLVEAFKMAFRPGEGPQLLIKCINGELRPGELRALEESTEGRSDIIVMNRYLDAGDSVGLMNMCDCYVSLHRSEGLGLTIAEAMLLGKPVIATGYSGNMDFMTETTSFVVPWTQVRVGSGAENYDPAAVWAEPDLGAAADLMRQVYTEPDRARQVAAAGRADLESRFTDRRTGLQMRARLEELWSARS